MKTDNSEISEGALNIGRANFLSLRGAFTAKNFPGQMLFAFRKFKDPFLNRPCTNKLVNVDGLSLSQSIAPGLLPDARPQGSTTDRSG